MTKVKFGKYVLACFLVVIFIVWFVIYMWMIFYNRADYEMIDLQEGWTVSVNDVLLDEEENLEDYKFDGLKKGDVITLDCELPDEVKKGESISFLIYLSVVDIYIDGENVYSYGHEYAAKNWLVGSGYHYATIPEDGTQHLHIIVTIAEDNAFTNIISPNVAEQNAIYINFITSNLLGISIGIFLAILGTILTVVSIAMSVFNRNFRRLVHIGFFSLLLGVWTLCNIKAFELVGANMAAVTTAEYMSLYYATIPFMLILHNLQENSAPWRKNLLKGVVAMLTVFAAVVTALHFANIEHLPKFLTYFHLLAGIGLVLGLIATAQPKRHGGRSSAVIYVGITAFCIFTAIDLVRFNLQKYVMQDDEKLLFSVLPIGALLLILCFVLSYVVYIYDMLVTEAQKEWLEQRAYTDVLCGINNRTKCNDDFAKLSVTKEDYALVNMDVNGLKGVNDGMGHASGDLLLTEFANILQQSFYNIGDVYRMGGDEFLAIVKGREMDETQGALDRMVNAAKMRSTDLPFTIEFSYGIATSIEFPNDTPEQIYSIADTRMYDMKTKMKLRKKRRYS